MTVPAKREGGCPILVGLVPSPSLRPFRWFPPIIFLRLILSTQPMPDPRRVGSVTLTPPLSLVPSHYLLTSHSIDTTHLLSPLPASHLLYYICDIIKT
nr:MAG TPA: hypothetical protein [Caudoviricetes sp.]